MSEIPPSPDALAQIVAEMCAYAATPSGFLSTVVALQIFKFADRLTAYHAATQQQLEEWKMVAKAAEAAEMQYHVDCVNAEQRYATLDARLREQIAEWRNTSQTHIDGFTYDRCAKEAEALLSPQGPRAPA